MIRELRSDRVLREKRHHVWVPSTLGHGEKICCLCFITNREAAALTRDVYCDSFEPLTTAAPASPTQREP